MGRIQSELPVDTAKRPQQAKRPRTGAVTLNKKIPDKKKVVLIEAIVVV